MAMKRPNKYQLSRQLGTSLQSLGWRVAVVESCTGGGLAYAITSIAGCSEWFERGIVSYSNEAKMELLGVKAETIEQYGEVSLETACEMAAGSISLGQADIALSITGVAGPTGGTPEIPVGTVCFGLAFRDGPVEAQKKVFDSGRKHVRDCAIGFALEWLTAAVKNQ